MPVCVVFLFKNTIWMISASSKEILPLQEGAYWHRSAYVVHNENVGVVSYPEIALSSPSSMSMLAIVTDTGDPIYIAGPKICWKKIYLSKLNRLHSNKVDTSPGDSNVRPPVLSPLIRTTASKTQACSCW